MRFPPRVPSLLLSAAALLSGCATYEEQSAAVARYTESGQYAKAAAEAKDRLDDASDRDKLVWKLEYAACERAAGNWKTSVEAFDDAENDLRKWDETPDLLVSSETSATLVNLTYLPYRGTGYDRIMVATYRAMNELAMGRIDRARVDLNRTLLRQDEAAEFAKRQVEAAREEAAEANAKNSGVNANRSAGEPQIAAIYGDLKSYRLYGDYVNPFSVWLHGIFFLGTSEGNSDIERANKSLERLHALVPNCAAATADYELVKRVRSGEPVPPTVWVVFETGMGPHRIEQRVDIPVFYVSETIPYAGIALPKLAFNGGHTPALAIEADGAVAARTESVASMDAIVATDFDREKDIIVTRSIVTAGLKVAAQYAINAAARRVAEERNDATGMLIYLGSMIATGAASYATTEADLRTWRTLPKDFQIARIKPPASGKIRLVGSSPAQSTEITLPPGSVHLILAKGTGAGTPLTVSVTTLRK